MREMVQVVARYALVMVICIVLIWVVDAALGVRHINANGAEMGSIMVTIHHMPQMLLTAALSWLAFRSKR